MKFSCDCVGGQKYCNTLQILDYKDNDCEIQIILPSKKKHTVYLKKDKIEKIIKKLQKICRKL